MSLDEILVFINIVFFIIMITTFLSSMTDVSFDKISSKYFVMVSV